MKNQTIPNSINSNQFKRRVKLFGLIIIIFILTTFLDQRFAFGQQTYQHKFDDYDQAYFSGPLTGYMHNLKGDIFLTEAPLMNAYLNMFIATRDKKYLDKLAILIKRVQDCRDDRIALTYQSLALGVSGSTTGCGTSFNTLNTLVSTSRAWAYLDASHNCDPTRFFHQTGQITYPMALLMYHLFHDYSEFLSAPLPQGELSGFINSYTGTPVTNYLEFVNWLERCVFETLDYQICKDWDGSYFRQKNEPSNQNCLGAGGNNTGGLNQQASIGRVLIIMQVVQTYDNLSLVPAHNQDYGHIADVISNNIMTAITNCTNYIGYTSAANQQYFLWRHLDDCNGLVEDISHALSEIELFYWMYKYNRIYSCGNTTQQRLENMNRFATNFETVVYQNPGNLFMNVYGTNYYCDQFCNPIIFPWYTNNAEVPHYYFLSGGYPFLSEFNPAIYQIVSDFFIPSDLPLTYESQGVILAYSQLTLHQQLFDPVVAERGNHDDNMLYVFNGGTNGKILPNDPDKNVILILKNQVNIQNWTVPKSEILISSIDNIKLTFPILLPQSNKGWHGIATGNVDATSPVDEIVTIESISQTLQLFKYDDVSKQLINISSIGIGVNRSIQRGDNIFCMELDANYSGKEILFVGYHAEVFLYGFDGQNLVQIPLPFSTISSNDVAGSSIGNYDNDGDLELALLQTNQEITILDIKPGPYFLASFNTQLINTTNPIYNNWTQIISVDYNGDDINEICVFNPLYDRDAAACLFYKVENGVLKQFDQQYMPPNHVGDYGIVRSGSIERNSSKPESIIICRDYDAQISVFNLRGSCKNLSLNNPNDINCSQIARQANSYTEELKETEVISELTGKLKIKPNPSHGSFEIEFTEKTILQMEVFDIYGKNIQNFKYSSNNLQRPYISYNVTLNDVSTGIYFIKALSNDGSVTTGKVLIE